MSQQINVCANPSSEINSTGYFTLSGTTGVSALTRPNTAPAGPGAGSYYTRATWSTASTAAGGGMAIGHATTAGVSRMDVVASTLYQAGVWVRPSKAKTLRVSALVYNTSGTQVGATVNGTAIAVTANTWTQLAVAVTTGVAAVRLVLQINDTDATFWSINNTLDVDGVMAMAGGAGTLPNYADPSTYGMWGWTGTAHNSTSILYTPTITLTQYNNDSPTPRCEVLAQDLPPGYITIRRAADARETLVRGAVMVANGSGVSILDTEIPSGVTSTYQAELFDANQASMGFTVQAQTTLTFTDDLVRIHQPLDPTRAVALAMDSDSIPTVSRSFTGEVVYPDNATVGRWIGGRRRGVEGLEFKLEASTVAKADALQGVFGSYTIDQVPVVCIRSTAGRIPRTLFLAVKEVREVDRSVRFGGTITGIEFSGDEVAPPFPGVVKPLLRYDDTDLFYPTYSGLDAAYGTYLARDRDYSKAGYAP